MALASGSVRGHVIRKGIVISPFNHFEKDRYLKIWRGPVDLQSLFTLKKTTRTFNFLSNEPLSWQVHLLHWLWQGTHFRFFIYGIDYLFLVQFLQACYDSRYGAVFWEKMRLMEDVEIGIEMPEWISTHPANDTCRDHLEGLESSAWTVIFFVLLLSFLSSLWFCLTLALVVSRIFVR